MLCATHFGEVLCSYTNIANFYNIYKMCAHALSSLAYIDAVPMRMHRRKSCSLPQLGRVTEREFKQINAGASDTNTSLVPIRRAREWQIERTSEPPAAGGKKRKGEI
jgi:hypothetical protein